MPDQVIEQDKAEMSEDIAALDANLPVEEEDTKVLAPTEKTEEPVKEEKVTEPEPKLEGKKNDLPEAEVTHDKPDDDSDEAFGKKIEEIQVKKGAHPNVENGIKTLKEIAKKERETRKALQKEIEAKEEEIKNARLITPELEKELEELRAVRREQNPEADPEFRSKFTDKLKSSDERAIQILKESGMKDDVAKFIMDNGGPVAMAMSKKKMPDGEQTHEEWMQEVVLPKMPGLQRSRIERILADGLDLREEMQKEIEQAKAQAPERQKKQFEEMTVKFNTSAQKAINDLGDDAKRWEVPKDATPEQKASIETHNARIDKAEMAFQKFLKSGQNPEAVAEMMVAAAHKEYLLEVNRELQEQHEKDLKEIEDLNKRIGRIKGSAPKARESNAILSKPTKEPTKMMSDDRAFEEFMTGREE